MIVITKQEVIIIYSEEEHGFKMGFILFKFSRVKDYALSTEIYSCHTNKSYSSINIRSACYLDASF